MLKKKTSLKYKKTEGILLLLMNVLQLFLRVVVVCFVDSFHDILQVDRASGFQVFVFSVSVAVKFYSIDTVVGDC